MRLTETDLRFIVETVGTERRDLGHVVDLLRDKPDLLEPILEERSLADRLLEDEEALVRVSPYLLFAVLLRRLRREVEGRSFIFERDSKGKAVPVFEADRVAKLLGVPDIREYLIEMLCSFVRTNTGVLYFKERAQWRKRKFSDLDMDDMIALCHLVEPEWKPRLYKRVADITLFLSGIYPDHAQLFLKPSRSRDTRGRTLPDYEREGRHFYSIAARDPEPPWPPTVFDALANKFNLAREALNTLSDLYLKPLRERYFQSLL
jgi:hypothetical protein